MVYGWAGKTLNVDLSTGKVSTEPWAEAAKLYLGGRGGNAYLFWRHRKVNQSPFDPEAPLIFGAGALAGTGLIGASKMEVTAVSAAKTETHGYGNVGMGSFMAPELKFAGYDNIVIKGRAEKPSYLYIYNDEVEVRDAKGVWGKGTFDTETLIREELDDPDVQVASIGPAGENLVVQSTVEHNYRSGTPLGASMGYKRLKAVSVRGTKPVEVSDPDKIRELNTRLVERVKKSKALDVGIPWDKGLDAYLQGFLVGDAGVVGDYESHEWRERPDVKKAYEESSLTEHFVKNIGCFGCPFPCQPLFDVPGIGTNIWRCYPTYWPWKIWMTDLKQSFKATMMMSDLGMDNKEVATIVSWLMHLYSDGKVSASDLDGIAFNKGSTDALFQTIHKLAYREGFGDALANGPIALAKKLGPSAMEYLKHNQGLTMRTFEFRAEPGTALGEAISERGNSLRATTYHVVIWDKPARGIYEGLPPEEKAAALAWSKKMFGSEDAIVATEYTGKPALLIYEMNGAAIADSLGYCTTMVRPSRVGAPGTQIGDMSYEFAAERYAAATGVPTDEATLFEAGERICNIERALAVMDGRSRETDTLHEYFFKVPIPDGPQKGRVLDKARFEAMKDESYALRGWEGATGLQKGSTLKKLGMNDVADELRKAKRLGKEKE